jgi:NAD+ kinase
MTVGIVGQKDNDRAAALAATLCADLAERVAVVVDETTADALATGEYFDRDRPAYESVPIDAMADCDLVVSIGGDGTFLYAVRGAGSTPIMGVNLGEVGFLNAVAPDDAVETVGAAVDRLLADGAVPTRAMPRVRARGDDWELPPALNEVVVQGRQRGRGGGLDVDVRVDGSVYATGAADGVLVATPTGSTAYNLSEGGPLVHPDVGGLVVTEMCAADAMPPLVVDDDSEVTVRVEGAPEAVVVSDGRTRQELAPPTTVTVSRAGEPVRIAGPSLDFFTALGKLE